MSATVTVCCRVPCGLILQLCKPAKTRIPLPGGGFVEEVIHQKFGKAYRVNGYAKPAGQDLGVTVIGAPRGGGYAITEGIPEQFWEEWLAQNAEHDAVLNGMIFAADRKNEAVAEAKDKGALWDGLHPMEQSGDPRNPKRRNPKGQLVDAVEPRDATAEG
jgi:hypothetical protein